MGETRNLTSTLDPFIYLFFFNGSLHLKYKKPELLLSCRMICVYYSCFVCLVVYQNCTLSVKVVLLPLCSLKVELIVNVSYAMPTVSR